MKLSRHIIVTFLITIATILVVYGGYTLYAAGPNDDPSVIKDFRQATDFFPAFNAYHREMNKFFNTKIEKLNTLMEDVDFYQNADKKKNFLPPADLPDNADIPTVIQKCGTENVSTYCVSMGALNIYTAYLTKLNTLRKTLKINPDTSNQSLNSVISGFTDNAAKIDVETGQAKDVMEATVAAYNEYRLAYPMHKKYQEIYTQLTKYRLILKDIRLRVAQFPERFIDASTDQCQ